MASAVTHLLAWLVAPKTEDLRCYAYISQSQVNEMYHQLPFHRRVPVNFSIGIKSKLFELLLGKKEETLNMYTRIRAIERHLHRKSKVGDVLKPDSFIKDVGQFYWDDYKTNKQSENLVSFSSIIDNCRIRLIGSKASAIGIPSQCRTVSYYDTEFIRQLVDEFTAHNLDSSDCNSTVDMDTTGSFDRKYYNTRQFHQTMEFLARPIYKENNIIIAVPVFIAIRSHF